MANTHLRVAPPSGCFLTDTVVRPLVSPDVKVPMGLASSGPQHLWLALGPSQRGKACEVGPR